MAEDKFASIRPYQDSDVEAVIRELRSDEAFISLLARIRFGHWGRLGVLRRLLQRTIVKRLNEINTIKDVQRAFVPYVEKLLATTTAGLSVSGLSAIEANQSYLFISNHRDIALDSTLINYVLHENGINTANMAIGDNLLEKPYIAHLMRLNKSFIIRRSLMGIKQQYRAHLLTSEYIFHCLAQGQSVWMAQRQGRAKNGDDRTDPAILKMLYSSFRKSKQPFHQVMAELRIVPVSIAYEFDPCDGLKAWELYQRAENGRYEKPEGEDTRSIIKGIEGWKGKVHLHFGRCIDKPAASAEAMAAQIDQQILANYHLFATNMIAYQQLEAASAEAGLGIRSPHAKITETDSNDIVIDEIGDRVDDAQTNQFLARLEQQPAMLRAYILSNYANPVKNKLNLKQIMPTEAEIKTQTDVR